MFYETKPGYRSLERIIQSRQGFQHGARVQFVDGRRRNDREVLIYLAPLEVRKPDLPPSLLQEFVIQRREQPRLDFRCIPELMAFTRPGVEGLLGQVARVGFVAGQTERKLVKRGIIPAHKEFKVLLGGQAAIVVIMSHRRANCSRKNSKPERRRLCRLPPGRASRKSLQSRELSGSSFIQSERGFRRALTALEFQPTVWQK